MKQFLQFLTVFLFIANTQAQTEFQISFNAIDQSTGNSISLDSVFVENITLNESITLYSPFTMVLSDENIGSVNEFGVGIQGLKVYPNPFTQNTNIEVSLSENQNVFINVFDITGKQTCNFSGYLQQGVHNFNFDPASAGIYFINVNGKVSKVVSMQNNKQSLSLLTHDGIKMSGAKQPIAKSTVETTIFPYVQGNSLRYVGYSTAYAPNSIFDSPSENKDYTFEIGESFYRLTNHDITTEFPSFVNIMFSVSNEQGDGVDYLTNDNFIVEEDGDPITNTEHFKYVRKLDAMEYKLKTVLLIDNSASVASVIEDVKTAAISFVQQKIDYQEFAIYGFSSEPVLIQDYTEDITALENAISSITTGYASTNLYGAVIEGVNAWDEIFSTDFVQKGFAIVFTDGEDTQGSSTLGEAISARGNKTLFMVGMGPDVDSDALNQLSSSGEYIAIANVNELEEAFAEIQTDIIRFVNSFYLLNYMTPTVSGNHDLTLMADPNNNTGSDSFINGTFSSEGFQNVLSGVYVNIGTSSVYGIDNIVINNGNQQNLKALKSANDIMKIFLSLSLCNFDIFNRKFVK